MHPGYGAVGRLPGAAAGRSCRAQGASPGPGPPSDSAAPSRSCSRSASSCRDSNAARQPRRSPTSSEGRGGAARLRAGGARAAWRHLSRGGCCRPELSGRAGWGQQVCTLHRAHRWRPHAPRLLLLHVACYLIKAWRLRETWRASNDRNVIQNAVTLAKFTPPSHSSAPTEAPSPPLECLVHCNFCSRRHPIVIVRHGLHLLLAC